MRADRHGDGRTAVTFARRFGDALRVGDGAAGERVIDDGLAAGISPEAMQALVIEPAMVRIGELWEQRAITVADEHLATAISERGLLCLFRTMSERRVRAGSRERVLLAATRGQHHILGLRMVADVLEAAGFEVMYLGASVPVSGLKAFAERHRPDVIGLSVGLAHEITALADALCEMHAVVPEARVMLGGRAVPPGLREVYPYVSSSMEVTAIVESLLAHPPQQLPRVVELMRAATAVAEPSDRAWARTDHVETDDVAARLAASANDAMDVARDEVRRAEVYRDLAYRDALTGLPNRRAFEERLAGLVATGTGGALLTIDVDEFKSVNDRYGHAAGDSLLGSVAGSIGAVVRADDTAARIGGDEFAVLLPRATTSVASRIAERIRVAVPVDSDTPVTVSIGVAPLAANPRAALLAADVALYAAKAAGRDRVTVHDTPTVPGPPVPGTSVPGTAVVATE